MTRREIARDCRFFLGDRPCVWHKTEGAVCTCPHYQAVSEQMLIVKLDAMGDVLRSTALLPALSEAHPAAAITWLTRRESVPLLAGNPFLTEVLELGPDTGSTLAVRQFDRVINLDASKTSAALATQARSPSKTGFLLDAAGRVYPSNDAARRWFEMGLFDDLKRQGSQTYQQHMLAILGLEAHPHHYVLRLTAAEEAAGRRRLTQLGVVADRPVIGLNTGAGGRWPLKQWRADGYLELATRLREDTAAQFVLLGGPGEEQRHEALRKAARIPLIDPGCHNPVRAFAALIRACDVVITGDTLAMHIALALGRRTIVLFGPTSAAEIDLYSLGEKVVPDMTCLSCYKTSCDFVPNCMDLISVDMVYAAVMRQLVSAPVPTP